MAKNLLKDLSRLNECEQRHLVHIIQSCTDSNNPTLYTLPLYSKEKAIEHLRRYIKYVDTPTGRRVYRKLYPWWWVPETGMVFWIGLTTVCVYGLILSSLGSRFMK